VTETDDQRSVKFKQQLNQGLW